MSTSHGADEYDFQAPRFDTSNTLDGANASHDWMIAPNVQHFVAPGALPINTYASSKPQFAEPNTSQDRMTLAPSTKGFEAPGSPPVNAYALSEQQISDPMLDIKGWDNSLNRDPWFANDFNDFNDFGRPVIEQDVSPEPSSAGVIASSGLAATNIAGPTNRNFPCPNCNKSFARRGDLSRHARLHDSRATRYSCPTQGCPREFLRKDKLADHRNRWGH